MAEAATPKVASSAKQGFVKERLKWASKPLGLLVLVLWVLHPATAVHTDYIHMGLVGLVVGACYGLVVYGERLASYALVKSSAQVKTPNRVPQEYYWGLVAQVMYDNS